MRVSKTLRVYQPETWRPLMIAFASLFILFALLWYRLGTLTGGRSALEIAPHYHITLHNVLHDPVNLPYQIGLSLLEKLGRQGLWAIRSLSALAGLVAAVCFFAILKRWHTTRLALIGTLLFVSSSWFLHVSRFASPEVLLLMLPILILGGLWLRDNRQRTLSVYLLVAAGTVLLYIPGMLWFVLAGIVWKRRLIAKELKGINTPLLILAIMAFIVLLLPLGWAIAHTPSIIKPIVGLPPTLPSPIQMIKNFLNVPAYIFVRGPQNPVLWLGRQPILDAFTTVMFVFGVYAYYIRKNLDQAKFLVGVLAISSILITLGGPVTVTVLIPFVYIVISAGIALMLQQWFTVFPRNPLARNIGLGLICTAVFLASFYQLNRYFVAWPGAPETRTTFSIKE